MIDLPIFIRIENFNLDTLIKGPDHISQCANAHVCLPGQAPVYSRSVDTQLLSKLRLIYEASNIFFRKCIAQLCFYRSSKR